VTPSGRALSAQLGPGLLGSLLDGIGRPLDRLAAAAGDFVPAGALMDTLDTARRWPFRATARVGDTVGAGDELGVVLEEGLTHRVLVPPGVCERVTRIADGEFTVADSLGTLDDGTALTLAQRWPLRVPRPAATRLPPDQAFVTGQRVFDFLFPVAEGGSAAVPGGFGTGKTVVEHSLAKFADADLVVYVGCGERGNEMAEVVQEFPKLVHPVTGKPIMSRAVLIANTSNMPVAAREASIYLGATIAEYYRDMGYRVALMIDSISRWAEALREISSRLQEMPGEEGYPTSLAARFGSFLERSGRVRTLGQAERTGAVTIVSAISPPGGDFSEPVTQAALRVCGALWALDPELAHARHFPAVDWATSYSLYADRMVAWFGRVSGEGERADWGDLRRELFVLLQREQELREVTGLIGPDALTDADRLLVAVAALVREIFLRQSAYDPNDAMCPPAKSHALAAGCMALHRAAAAAAARGAAPDVSALLPARAALVALRDAPADQARERLAAVLALTARVERAEAPR
jgi:V/A-type H+-transporting ATPase subunit A